MGAQTIAVNIELKYCIGILISNSLLYSGLTLVLTPQSVSYGATELISLLQLFLSCAVPSLLKFISICCSLSHQAHLGFTFC